MSEGSSFQVEGSLYTRYLDTLLWEPLGQVKASLEDALNFAVPRTLASVFQLLDSLPRRRFDYLSKGQDIGRLLVHFEGGSNRRITDERRGEGGTDGRSLELGAKPNPGDLPNVALIVLGDLSLHSISTHRVSLRRSP